MKYIVTWIIVSLVVVNDTNFSLKIKRIKEPQRIETFNREIAIRAFEMEKRAYNNGFTDSTHRFRKYYEYYTDSVKLDSIKIN